MKKLLLGLMLLSPVVWASVDEETSFDAEFSQFHDRDLGDRFRPHGDYFDVITNGGFSTQCSLNGRPIGNWVDCRSEGTCANRKALIASCRTKYGRPDFSEARWDYFVNGYAQANTMCLHYGQFIGEWRNCYSDGTCMNPQAIVRKCAQMYGHRD